jgi:PilZ domain-containing protein
MSTRVVGESRRSTRVPLQILITLLSLDGPLTCDGETITVSRHGALISSGVPLRKEMKIKIQVFSTGMRADAKVIHVDPERPRMRGIALEKPENIWDLSLPPNDWYDDAHES